MYIITPTIKQEEYRYADRFRKLNEGESYRSDKETSISREKIAEILINAELV